MAQVPLVTKIPGKLQKTSRCTANVFFRVAEIFLEVKMREMQSAAAHILAEVFC